MEVIQLNQLTVYQRTEPHLAAKLQESLDQVEIPENRYAYKTFLPLPRLRGQLMLSPLRVATLKGSEAPRPSAGLGQAQRVATVDQRPTFQAPLLE